MDDATRLVREAASSASSNDDLVNNELGDMVWENDMLVPATLDSPLDEETLDEETLDEQASTQMGSMYEPRRRDAN